tara:strand:+ start:59 stop:223 length:165 start_codon:yes stop_codon:yes gene_type:complete
MNDATDLQAITEEVFDKPDYSKIATGKELKLFKNLQWTLYERIEYELKEKTQKS